MSSKDERAKKERNIIKGSIIRNTAISAKRNTDKLLKSMGVTDGETKDTPNTNNKNTPNVNNNNDNDDKKKQKDYASTYDRSASRPTQVIIHIDNLAKFDNTSISKNANDRAIAEAIETKIADAVSMLSAQILATASSTISQGLS